MALWAMWVVGVLSWGDPSNDSFSGVWMQHGNINDVSHAKEPFLLGVDLPVKWSDVETSDGVWDWNATDTAYTAASDKGFFVETALLVGPDSPQWIYSSGVPKVTLPKNETIHGWTDYPYYLSPQYQELFLRAIRTFSDHLNTLPSAVRPRLVGVQAMYGSTGDDTPWHGTPINPKYDITDAQWWNYTTSLAPSICKAYTGNGFHVLWNADIDKLNVYLKDCPGSFIKAGMVSHGFQVNFEADNYKGKGHICHTAGFHCRGESWPFCQHGYYEQAPVWATYWHLLWQLTFGVDMPGLSQVNLQNSDYTPYYEYFNVFAGSWHHPSTAKGAFVALRDGLDVSDVVRFPESTYGKATLKNKDRLDAVVAAFKDRGAEEGDPQAAQKSAMASRRRKKMNDAGWRIWDTNYGNGLMNQVSPFNSSIGWWRVGPLDQPYGRFARGFHHASGMNRMDFTLDRRLFGGLPLQHTLALRLRVVYYDDGTAQWTLLYDAQGAPQKVATRVTNKNTKRWQEVTVDVKDAYFGSRCGPHSADLSLVAGTNDNAVFHLISVVR